MREYMTIDTSSLSDSFLTALQAAGERSDPEASPDLRRFNAEMAAAARQVRGMRAMLWAEYVDATGFPSWEVCVAALPRDTEVVGED